MWRILNRLLLMLTQTLAVCCVTAGQQCHGDIFEYEQYNYKIWNDRNRTISEAIELADQTNSSLLVIERPEIQQLVLQQMQSCNIAQVFLGIKQIESARLLTDSAPWSWISDCDDAEAGVITFQGCFFEVGSDLDLPVISNLSPFGTTGNICIIECRTLQQKYAGILVNLNTGFRCFCGQSYGKHGAATGCSYACPEDTSHSCGNSDRQSVYHTKSNPFWGKWLIDQPQYARSPYAYCGAISQDGSTNNYRLRNFNCGSNFRYVCEFNASEIAHMGCTHHLCNGSKCYCVNYNRVTKWHKAKYDCRELGGRLVVIATDQESDVVSQFLLSNRLGTVWVGAYRETFMRLDNGNTLCYTNFNQTIEESTAYAFMTSDGEWEGFNDARSNILASTITQTLAEWETTTDATEQNGSRQPTTSSELPDQDETDEDQSPEPDQSPDTQAGDQEQQGLIPYNLGFIIMSLVILLDVAIIASFVYYYKKMLKPYPSHDLNALASRKRGKNKSGKDVWQKRKKLRSLNRQRETEYSVSTNESTTNSSGSGVSDLPPVSLGSLKSDSNTSSSDNSSSYAKV